MGCGVGETVEGWWEELKKQQWMVGEGWEREVWGVGGCKSKD